MSEFSHISRLQEENRKALVERQQRLLTCEKFEQDYEKLEALLKTLPHKTSHEVMVPIGSVAFMPGQLVHTNEITVLLGDNWFAERSASQALEIVARRKKYLKSNIAGINEDIKSFDARLKFAADIQSAAEEKSEVKEIREELSEHDEERLLNQGGRKAHPKTKRFGGSRKVEGLKGKVDNKISNKKSKETKPLSSEDLSLLARLDELEEKETVNAELDQLDDFDDDETTEVAKSNDDVRWEQTSATKTKNVTKKKVQWEAFASQKEDKKSIVDSDDGDDDDEDVKTTIAVTFSSSSTSTQQQIPEQCSEQPALFSPADIYSQFAPKRELKSILRKPSMEEKVIQMSMDNPVTTHQDVAQDTKTNTEKEHFDSLKAFTGTIVEKPSTVGKQELREPKINTSQTGKKQSRFKAARQKYQ